MSFRSMYCAACGEFYSIAKCPTLSCQNCGGDLDPSQVAPPEALDVLGEIRRALDAGGPVMIHRPEFGKYGVDLDDVAPLSRAPRIDDGLDLSKAWLDESGSLDSEFLKARIARGFQIPPILVGVDGGSMPVEPLPDYVPTPPTELEQTIEALTTRGCDRTPEQQVLVDNYWSRQSELKQAALDDYTRQTFGRAPRNPAAQQSSREADKRKKQKRRAQRQARKRR